ncbi:MAG: phosphate ABC transporter substrate-binding protein PstS [Burkholderiales bacterium]|jgi:phosphate transport system substrate-binding protein|nr:phosphate ABC transporter substrate-binding protein PstS [Burkholderiales bacterium]
MFYKWQRLLAGAASIFALAASAQAVEVTGAGASFPAPLYAKWADVYSKATGHKINYQSIGSGGGIKQIQAKTVDFGATDAPMKPEDLAKSGLVQFPTVIGGVVPVVNIKGISNGQLRLSGSVLADIYLGKITSWNDPAIAALNPEIKLPAAAIAVVRRSDGSGTSFIFTNYLSKVSAEWKEKVGEGTAVQWPTGLGGKGNEGVSAFVLRVNNSIGYVESAYARQGKMAYVLLQNAAGQFVAPTEEAFRATATGAKWDPASFYEILTDQPGETTWPIAGATFILMHKTQGKPAQAKEALNYFAWAYREGDKMASDLDYVPLPEPLIKAIEASWAQIRDASGKAVR